MTRNQQLAWLAKVALTAFGGLLLSALIAGAPQIQVTENDGQGAEELVLYRNEPTPLYALIGTSLTYRLKEEYFLPMRVRNLALPGRSVVTSLEILGSYPKLPANIFVETSVMTWSDDANFVKKFSYDAGGHFKIGPLVRGLVAYINSQLMRNGKVKAQLDDSILNEPPAQYDNKDYVEWAKKQWTGHNQDAEIASNVDALAHLVTQLEKRGSNVYLYEMPLAPGMTETNVMTTTRKLIHERFADQGRWLTLNYPVNQLRFRDHAHLDERSALIVARAMRNVILAGHPQSGSSAL
jgi:hypothetical protein